MEIVRLKTLLMAEAAIREMVQEIRTLISTTSRANEQRTAALIATYVKENLRELANSLTVYDRIDSNVFFNNNEGQQQKLTVIKCI